MGQDERFFIVTTGRAGSTLLAAILATSGANFGLPTVNSWDARGGAMECPDFNQASALLGKAYQLSEVRPPDPYRALYWTIYRRGAKRLLKRSLTRATFAKSGDADLCLPVAIQLGYAPRVIVCYRRPEGQIASQFVRGKYQSVDYLVARYIRVMRNALGAVRILGGCVVSYDDLHDANAYEWGYALAELTGLDPNALFKNRLNLIRPEPKDQPSTCLSLEAERLWREAEDLRGAVFNAMRPAVRVRNESHEPAKLDTLQLLEDLENNPICSVAFDNTVPCIFVKWKGYATSMQFRYIHEHIIHLVRQHGVRKILGDDTVVPIIRAEDQKWITEDWLPRAIAAGLKVGANKKSVQPFGKLSIESIQSQLPPELAIRSFDDLDDARLWLHSVEV